MSTDKVATEEYFGGCPICGKSDGYINIGREHWAYCKEHTTTWGIGSNLFSSWREESAEDQRRQREELGFDYFRKVKPVRPQISTEKPSALTWRIYKLAEAYGFRCSPIGLPDEIRGYLLFCGDGIVELKTVEDLECRIVMEGLLKFIRETQYPHYRADILRALRACEELKDFD